MSREATGKAGKDGPVDYKLRVNQLRKTYGSVVALARATVDMAEGEFLTLLGPSGSGKTTLLMMVAGLVQPDSGEIWIDGRLATYTPTHQRDVGVVFQNYALFPHLSVFENIAFPLRMRRVPEAEIARRVSEALATVQLAEMGSRLPRELSGGQQQRIALARCIVYQPSIILMDEPLGALDKKLRDHMQLEIKELHTKLGITVLYVTHDQEEAMVMSDRICLMNDGEIVQLGTPDDLYFRPKSVFAADFLGESNILPAEVTETGGARTVLKAAAGGRVLVDGPHAAAVGARVSFMVRPEAIRVLAEGESDDNEATVRLRNMIVAGMVTKLYAELPDGAALSVTQLTKGARQGFQPGQTLRVGWSAARTVVLNG